jgi:hypothetical protein
MGLRIRKLLFVLFCWAKFINDSGVCHYVAVPEINVPERSIPELYDTFSA